MTYKRLRLLRVWGGGASRNAFPARDWELVIAKDWELVIAGDWELVIVTIIRRLGTS